MLRQGVHNMGHFRRIHKCLFCIAAALITGCILQESCVVVEGWNLKVSAAVLKHPPCNRGKGYS